MKNKNFNSLGLAFLIFFMTSPVIKQSYATEFVDLITSDQKKLEINYWPPRQANAPAIILVPDTRCDGKIFGELSSHLNKAGYAVIAMDMRYKDIIAKTKNIEDAISLIQKQDLYPLVDFDLESVMEFVKSKSEIDQNRICLIGTSLGSRVVIAGGRKYNVSAMILVSLSGEEAWPGGGNIKDLLEQYGARPILFISAERDWGGNYKAAEFNRKYFNWAKEKKDLKIWEGQGHGVDLLKSDQNIQYVIEWLKTNL